MSPLQIMGWLTLRDRSRYQIGFILGKVPPGGGGVNPKIHMADFGPLKRAFFRTFSKKNGNIVFRKLRGGGGGS